MWSLISRLLKRSREISPHSLIEERWQTGFTGVKSNRFLQEDTSTYSAAIRQKALVLSLKKRNLFAWVDNPLYRYRDFFIEAEISFDPENGYSSVGFILRRADDSNYYYFLISNRGRFRFDAVFNGHPRPLIEWTPCDLPPERMFVRILARGEGFSFFLEEDWLAEIEDYTVVSGGVSFAGQNYDEKETATFRLHRFRINSVPIDVEAQHVRWNKFIPVEPERRIRLARTIFSAGQYPAALIQIAKAFRDHDPDADELFLLAECQTNVGDYGEALSTVSRVLEMQPDNEQAILEKSNLLYRLNRFLDLRDFLKTRIEDFPNHAVLWNLFGNAWYSLGNWVQASSAYQKAIDLNPEMPIFSLNAARAYDRLGQPEAALDRYLQSARLFFRQEAYEDLARILSRLEALDPDNDEVLSIKGKVLFHEQNYSEAKALFKRLLDKGYEESSVSFMYGLILAVEGDREPADLFFQQAADSEPDYYLYWFKLAENRYLLHGDPGEALQKAIETAPDDPWVLNLAGQYYMDNSEPETAVLHLEKACVQADEEMEIHLNYSEALFQSGDPERSLSVLAKWEDNADALNQIANIEVRKGDLKKAVSTYERAMAIDPSNPAIRENCASAYIELDMINRAEELLAALIDSHPTGRTHNLIGNVARIKGEYQRAETAYTEGVRIDPRNEDLVLNLADLLIERRRFPDAERILESLPGGTESVRSAKLRHRIRDATHMKFVCVECGREWWAPLDIEPQPRMKIQAEPPPESPAGKCPECGSVYCIRCAEAYLNEGRFYCHSCGTNLKLSDDHLKYLVSSYLQQET